MVNIAHLAPRVAARAPPERRHAFEPPIGPKSLTARCEHFPTSQDVRVCTKIRHFLCSFKFHAVPKYIFFWPRLVKPVVFGTLSVLTGTDDWRATFPVWWTARCSPLTHGRLIAHYLQQLFYDMKTMNGARWELLDL